MGAPDILAGRRADPAGALRRALAEHTSARAARGRVRRGARGRFPRTRRPSRRRALEPRALVVLEERLRPDATETIEFMREQQVDLKLISGDARSTVTAVAHAVGIPAGRRGDRGPELPADRAGLDQAAEQNTIFCRITPEQKKPLVARSATGDGSRR